MTNKFLLNLLGFNPDLTSRQPRVDTLSLVSRQSDLLTYLGRIAANLLLILTIGSGNVWGATATFSITGKSGSSSPYTVTGTLSGAPTGATASCSSTYNNANQLTGGKAQKLTLSGFDGCTITGVKLNMKKTSSGPNATVNITVNGSTKLATKSISLTTSAGDKTVSLDNTTTVVGAGETLVIEVSASKNSIYVYNYQITYTPGGDPHEVSFSTGTGNPAVASRTEASGGAGITLPSTSDLTPACSGDGWTLYGWTTTAYGSSSTTTAPTTTLAGRTGATYYPTEDVTLHAVYVKSVTSGDPVAQTLTFSYASHENWELHNCTDKSSYWLLEKNKSAYVESPTISDLSTITSISVNAGYYGGVDYGKFKVYGAGTQYGDEQSPSSNSDSGGPYNLSPSPNPLSGSGKIKIECTGTSTSGKGTRLGGVTINYTAPPTTYYYWSAPTCCTELGSINGSVKWSKELEDIESPNSFNIYLVYFSMSKIFLSFVLSAG